MHAIDHLLASTLGENAARADLRVPNPRECLYVVPSTICNLKCRFCAYPKSTLDRRVMPHRLFVEVIDKACDYGFDTFGLTPLLGEALTDPHFQEKLEHLERHSGVRAYSFTTNFTLASATFIDGLRHLKKIRWLSISIYGHDEDTFFRITQAGPQHFHVLLDNLARLIEWPAVAVHVELRLRTSGEISEDQCHPRLREILSQYRARNVRIRIPNDRYSNWGGIISPSDLLGLNIRLKPEPEKTNVPCVFLFHKHTVLPDGRLNACYAEDGNATMIIGDLTRQRFDEIYSIHNVSYMNLIRSHFEGRYNKTCHECTGYRSVKEPNDLYSLYERPFLSMTEFVDLMTH